VKRFFNYVPKQKLKPLLYPFKNRDDKTGAHIFYPLTYTPRAGFHTERPLLAPSTPKYSLTITKDHFFHILKIAQNCKEDQFEEAQYVVASIYHKGLYGVETNLALAEYWYKRAIENKYHKATIDLAKLYLQNCDDDKSLAKGLKLLGEIEEKGHSEAQYDLAFCFIAGLYTKKNPSKAIECFEKAAAKGLAKAQRTLAGYYQRGEIVEKNLEKAAELYEKSAEQGDIVAIYNIAECYEKGLGVEKNFQKSVKWYEKLADGKMTDQKEIEDLSFSQIFIDQETIPHVELFVMRAQFNLAKLYYEAKDFTNAKKWFEEAAKNGNSDSSIYLDQISLHAKGRSSSNATGQDTQTGEESFIFRR